jgi:hypothetical protein
MCGWWVSSKFCVISDHKSSESEEQAGPTLLRCRWTCQEDAKNCMVPILLFVQVRLINLILMLDFVLQKASIGSNPITSTFECSHIWVWKKQLRRL